MYKLIHILTAFLPSGGPNTPFLLLSSLDMMMFCVCWAVVWAEKLMMLGLYFSLSSLFSKKSWNKFTKSRYDYPVRQIHGQTWISLIFISQCACSNGDQRQLMQSATDFIRLLYIDSLTQMYTLFPVPVGPTNRHGFWLRISKLMRAVYRTVSTVGTMISLNSASLGMGGESLISSAHCTHLPAPWIIKNTFWIYGPFYSCYISFFNICLLFIFL